MVSIRFILIGATFSLYIIFTFCDDALDTRSLQTAIKTQEEKDLIEALQAVLDKLKSKTLPKTVKKFGQLPSIRMRLYHYFCDAGEQCAARKGARVGKLCGCPQGTTCDFFIMKCL